MHQITISAQQFIQDINDPAAINSAFRRGFNGQEMTPAIAGNLLLAESYQEGLVERSLMIAEPASFDAQSLQQQAWIALDRNFASVEKTLRGFGMEPERFEGALH